MQISVGEGDLQYLRLCIMQVLICTFTVATYVHPTSCVSSWKQHGCKRDMFEQTLFFLGGWGEWKKTQPTSREGWTSWNKLPVPEHVLLDWGGVGRMKDVERNHSKMNDLKIHEGFEKKKKKRKLDQAPCSFNVCWAGTLTSLAVWSFEASVAFSHHESRPQPLMSRSHLTAAGEDLKSNKTGAVEREEAAHQRPSRPSGASANVSLRVFVRWASVDALFSCLY